MAPRLSVPCVCDLRSVFQKALSSRAHLSTTSRVLAEQKTTASELLSIGNDASPTSQRLPPIRRTAPERGPQARRPNPQGNMQSNQSILNLIAKSPRGPPREVSRASTEEELQKHKLATDLTKQIPRRWKAGDIYAPHDLSPAEMRKWKRSGRPEVDAFDLLAMNPIDEYKNFSIMSEYITPMGRIRHSNDTGLRPVNQRRISKAVRRSIGLGLMPSVHKHPEILQKEMTRRNDQLSRSRML